MFKCKKPSTVIVFVFAVNFINKAGSTNIDVQCTTDGECPTDSTCRLNSCNVNVCLCNNNYVKNSGGTACLSLTLAGQSCGGTTQCVLFSTCNSGLCQCSSPSSQRPDNYCNDAFGGGLHGTSCSINICAPSITGLSCISSSCQCGAGYRDANLYEKAVQPEVPCYAVGSATANEDCSSYTTAFPVATTSGIPSYTLLSNLTPLLLTQLIVVLHTLL